MTDSGVIRVMVVDDHLVVRKGYLTVLMAFNDLQLVEEAASGEEALLKIPHAQPDVILMDLMMPQMNGVETMQAIREQYPNIQFVALTSFDDDAQLVQAAMEAGAIGYLFKNVSVKDLVDAIRSAYAGRPTLAPEATMMLIQSKKQRSPTDYHLSQRELEVLALLSEGLSNREIGDRLSISHYTVKFHVSSVLGKLGASSRTEAVSIAHQNNLLNGA